LRALLVVNKKARNGGLDLEAVKGVLRRGGIEPGERLGGGVEGAVASPQDHHVAGGRVGVDQRLAVGLVVPPVHSRPVAGGANVRR
jgi:hypothetical protein